MSHILNGRSGVLSRLGADEIQSFADKYRLKARISEDGTKIVPGKWGHLYLYDDGVLAVFVMPNPPRRRYWGCTRSSLLAAGLIVVQDGDGEGAATFDPDDLTQAKAAIRAAGVQRKRAISPEQREQQIERLRASAGKALSARETHRDTEPLVAAMGNGSRHPSGVSRASAGRRCATPCLGGGTSK